MRRVGVLTAAASLALFLTIATAGRSEAQSGLQYTPDSKHLLINKDVGDERWAITENKDDGTVTGNVFFTDGRAPAFVWCLPTSVVDNPDPDLTQYSYDCYGTDTCTPDSCPQWTFISSVTLTGSFFKPKPQPTVLRPGISSHQVRINPADDASLQAHHGQRQQRVGKLCRICADKNLPR